MYIYIYTCIYTHMSALTSPGRGLQWDHSSPDQVMPNFLEVPPRRGRNQCCTTVCVPTGTFRPQVWRGLVLLVCSSTIYVYIYVYTYIYIYIHMPKKLYSKSWSWTRILGMNHHSGIAQKIVCSCIWCCIKRRTIMGTTMDHYCNTSVQVTHLGL